MTSAKNDMEPPSGWNPSERVSSTKHVSSVDTAGAVALVAGECWVSVVGLGDEVMMVRSVLRVGKVGGGRHSLDLARLNSSSSEGTGRKRIGAAFDNRSVVKDATADDAISTDEVLQEV